MRKALVILLFVLFTASTGLMVYFYQQQSQAKAKLKKANSNLVAAHARSKTESDKLFDDVKQKVKEKADLDIKLKELGLLVEQAEKKFADAMNEKETMKAQVAAIEEDLRTRNQDLKEKDDKVTAVGGQLESFKKLAEAERKRAAPFVELGMEAEEILALKAEYDALLKKSEQLQQRFKDAGMTPDELLARFQDEAKSALTKLGTLKSRRPTRAERITESGLSQPGRNERIPPLTQPAPKKKQPAPKSPK